MESLAALGLAANIAQFVSFAAELFSKANEVYSSTKGCTDRVLNLEKIHCHLRDLCSNLGSAAQRDQDFALLEGQPDLAKFVSAINALSDLSQLCEKDCDRLLEVLRKLQRGNGSKNHWRSFKLAVKTVWKGNEITELEQRLHVAQSTLTVHICTVTKYGQGVFQRQLEDLRRETEKLQVSQSSKFDEFARHLDDLGTRIAAAGLETSPDRSLRPAGIKSLQNGMSQLSLAQADVAKERMILKSLMFESRSFRHSSITEAHGKTLEWVFNDHCSQLGDSSWGNLCKWLQTGHGFFWVSGKPGSGKSTLMKFVADHPETAQALGAWSYPKSAVVLKHFFWSAGTSMQKSWQGFLQTLLYEIFRQVPDLIEATCTKRWPNTLEEPGHGAWHSAELRRTLQRIASKESLPTKLCFFVDGLDEFDGDHLEFCQTLRELSKSNQVKFCVSSRPWNVFEDSFGGDTSTKLYMDRLTHSDIRSFAEESLQEHPRWQDVNIEDGSADWLIEQITERAAGVFLWVFLVTRQLRNGLTEYDSLSDMKRRLEHIPRDLEAFFKQILGSVEPFYHGKMATTLQVALAAREPAPVAFYQFHDEEYENEEYAVKLPIHPLSSEQLTSMRELVKRRLSGRCRGLLEVNNERVEFLHRTVMDYLRTPEMSRYLDGHAPAWFKADLSLLRAFTAYIKGTRFQEFVHQTGFASYSAHGLFDTLREAYAHAKLLGEDHAAYKLLDELALGIPQMVMASQVYFSVSANLYNPASLYFWDSVVDASLDEYLRYAVQRLPYYFPDFKAQTESALILFMLMSCTAESEPHEQMSLFRRLLKSGNDLPEIYGGRLLSQRVITHEVVHQAWKNLGQSSVSPETMHRVWKETLQRVIPSNLTLTKPGSLSNRTIESTSWKLEWVLDSGLIPLILNSGENPNLRVYEQPASSAVPIWINFVLLSLCLPPGSSHQEQYLEVLDCFIANGADIQATMLQFRPVTPCLQRTTGLDLFLDHLFQNSINIHSSMDYNLLFRVSERLLIMAVFAGVQTYDYWPILDCIFPPQDVSYLKLMCFWDESLG